MLYNSVPHKLRGVNEGCVAYVLIGFIDSPSGLTGVIVYEHPGAKP